MAVLHGVMTAYNKQNEDWMSYTERLEQYFQANGVIDADKQRAIFLSVCGPSMYQTIRNLVAPKKPTEFTLKELIEKVENHLNPSKSVIVHRFYFNTRVMKREESISDYVSELRRLAEHCGFKDAETLEEMLRDRIVCGIHDIRLQRRLLAEKNLTFKSTLELIQSWETADSSAKDLQKPQPQSERIQLLSKTPGKRQNTSAHQKGCCMHCGGHHQSSECRFKTATCNFCKKRGHIARVCLSKPSAPIKNAKSATQQQSSSKPSVNRTDETSNEQLQPLEESESTYSLFTLSRNRRNPIRVTVTLNSAPLDMEVDTGAARSLISESTFRQLQQSTKLPSVQPSRVQLRTYTGEKLAVRGSLTAELTYQQQSKPVEILVVEGNGPSLLGRDILDEIRLDWVNIYRLRSRPTQALDVILDSHQALFGEELGKITGVKAKIYVKANEKPRFHHARPIPYALRGKVEKELHRLEEQGVIAPVEFSDWAAPIVPVVKKDGSIRICGDYRLTVNCVAKLETYPLPRIEDLLASLAGGKTFTKLDVAHAYQQVELEEESRKFVTINTHKGLYTYNRLPFGVASAPAIYQRLMESILQGMSHVCVYIDDILITETSEEEHLQNVQEVLERLEKAGLQLKREKCAFMMSEIEYLGYRITAEGLQPSRSKIDAIQRAPAPQNLTQLCSFLGAINYYCKFLPNMSDVLAPLYQLLQKGSRWRWNSAQQKAFEEAKGQLSTPPLLVHFDPQKPLVLSCDASPYGVGAVLSHAVDGEEKPIAYASRSLAVAEKKYSQLDKEGLAILFGVKRFHQFLYGRESSSSTLTTSHSNISLMKNEPFLKWLLHAFSVGL